MTAKVALVTGASRSIGGACPLAPAAAGLDVALAARTRTPGERRQRSVTAHASDTSPLPRPARARRRDRHDEGRPGHLTIGRLNLPTVWQLQ